MTRILLADHQALVRRGLRRVLEDRLDWTVVAEADDGVEAVRQAIDLRPDVAIVDLRIPLVNGMTIREILRHSPGTHILVLGIHSDYPYLTQVFEAGAIGYLLKDRDDLHLVDAVETVSGGELFLSPSILREAPTPAARYRARRAI